VTVLALSVLPAPLAIVRLEPAAPVPDWAWSGELCSVTRSADELSVVCGDAAAPPDARAQRGWRALAVEGPLAFALTGVLAALAAPLADARVSIFALSTYDTDYVLVRGEDLARACDALRAAGHTVAGT
jgi:hypothetical protein